MKRSIKILSVVLTVAMIFATLPMTLFAQDLAEWLDSIASGEATGSSFKDVFELTDKRTATTKHFRLEDGSFYVAQYDTDIHYLDENGEYQDIDNSLSVSGSEISTSNAKIKFAKKTTGSNNIFTLHDGNRKLTLALDNANKKIEGKITNNKTEFGESATQLQKMTTLDNISASVIYEDILVNTDLEYVINGLNIKENIIVKAKADSYSYSFTMQLNDLTAELDEKGGIYIYDDSTSETVYTIPSPVMWDSDHASSDAVSMSLTQHGNGKYTITVTADSEWMNASERVYPVTIDPPIYTTSASAILDLDVCSTYPNRNKPADDSLWVNNAWQGYIKLTTLPTIPSSAYITNANLSLQCFTSAAMSGYIMAYDVVSDWDSTLTWNKVISLSNPQGKPADNPTDYQQLYTTLVNGAYQLNKPSGYTWNITPIVRKWYSGQNYGLTLKADTATTFTGEARFRSNDYATASKRPIFSIDYRDMKGVEDYYSYTAQNIGNAGVGYVNNASGSLTFAISTLSTTDALFGYLPSLIYNSCFSGTSFTNTSANTPYTAAQTGYGFKLSMQESIVQKTYVYREMDASEITKKYYVWTDSDGTEHTFLTDENGDYRDEDGLGLKLSISTSTITMIDRSYNQKIFTAVSGGWVMTSIKDSAGNELVFTVDSNNRVTKISVKPNGLTAIDFLTLTYNSSGLISRIENASAKRAVTFLYSSMYNGSVSASNAGYLRQINYVHFTTSDTIDCSVYYAYDSSGQLISANDGLTLYKVNYTYNSDKVISVTEYGGSSNTVGQTIGITYNGDLTSIRSSGTNDIYGDTDDILTKYAFDYAGRTISAYSTDIYGTTVYGASSGEYVKNNDLAENHIKTSSTISDATANYITNGGFELLGTNGLPLYWNCYVPYESTVSTRTNSTKFGPTEVVISASGEEATELSQYVFLEAGKYTLSAEFSASNPEPCNIELEVIDTHATFNTQACSYDQGSASENQMFASITFEVMDLDSGGDFVSVIIRVSPSSNTSTVYVDNVTIQEGTGVGKFSYVNYGSFEQSLDGYSPSTFWSMTDSSTLTYETVSSEFDQSLKITGNLNSTKAAKQTIVFNSLSSTRQPTFLRLSGFAKATSPMLNERSTFSLSAVINYTDNTSTATDSIPTANFSKDTDEWQFVNIGISVESGKKIKSVDIYCNYDYNFGTAYFDDIKLVAVEDHTVSGYVYDEETGLTEAYITGLGSSYYTYYEQYEGDSFGGLLQSVVTTGTNKFTYYSYDNNTNKVSREDIYSLAVPLDIQATLEDVNNDVYYYVPFDDMGNATDSGMLYDYGSVTYTYNAYGLLTQTRSTRVGYSYPTVSTAAYNITSGSKIFGSISEQTDTNGYVTKYFYNSDNGELLATVSGKSGESTYDYGYAYTYDALGRVTQVVPATCSATATSATANNSSAKATYSYNAQSRLASVQTTSTTYSFTYDVFGNADTIGVGSVELVDYEYNPKNGKLLSETFSNNFSAKYTYDPLDRIEKIWYNDDVSASTSAYYTAYTYTYDTNGNIAKVTDHINNEETVFKYDTSGRPVYSCKYNLDNTNGSAYVNKYSIQAAYDDQSRIARAVYSIDYMAAGSGANTANLLTVYNYGYDEENRLSFSSTEIGNTYYTKEYTYDSYNRLIGTYDYIDTGMDLISNTESYTYATVNGNTTALVHTYSTSVNSNTVSYSFAYDKRGNISEIRNASTNALIASFTYDTLNRLTRENNAQLGKTYTYTYDTAGNITSKKTYAYTAGTLGSVQSTKTYTYSNSNWGDQLTAYNGAAITYDANGNPLTYNNGSSYTFTWTAGRRLATAVKGSYSLSFTYNENGIRTSKTINAVKHEYILDGTNIIAEKWGASGVTHYIEYIYDANGVIGMIYHNTSMSVAEFEYYYFEKNLQGDIVTIYDIYGSVVVKYTYDAWGNVSSNVINANSPALYNGFKYRGYYYDTETGLYYLNSRYYDPAVGRFINADSYISTGQGLAGYNMYAYCRNEPVFRKDSLGTDDVCIAHADDDSNPLNDFGGTPTGNGGMYHYSVDFSVALNSSLINGGIYNCGYSAYGYTSGGYGVCTMSNAGTTSAASAKVAATIKNDIIDLPRTGHALQTDDHHAFSDIVDNYAGYANKTSLGNATLYQLQGSLGGKAGRFEWIVENQQVTHRFFVKGGGINGIPIKK